MWAYDFLQADPACKTLKTHLKANNTLGKWWFKEYYLKEKRERLNPLFRLMRLVVVLCIYLVVVIHITAHDDWSYGRRCLKRLECKINCIVDSFPNLFCTLLPNFEITYAGNRYTKLYNFKMYDKNFTGAAFAICAGTVPEEALTVALEDELLYDQTRPRTNVCFPPCRQPVPRSFYGTQYLESRRYGAQWDTPQLMGVGSDTTEVPVLTEMVMLDDGNSTATSTEMATSETSSTTTTIFSAAAATAIPGDSRPLCNGTMPSDHLICVDDNDTCHKTQYRHEICIDCDEDADMEDRKACWCFTWSHIILSICVVMPFLFLYDAAVLFTLKLDTSDINNVRNGSIKCGCHWVLSFFAVSIIVYVVSLLIKSGAFSRPGYYWCVWTFTVLLDQVRNIIVQSLIWYILIRRFGQIPLLDEEEEFRDDSEDDQLTPLEVLRKIAVKITESRRFDLSVYAILGLYAVFLLALIAAQDHLSQKQKILFEDIDTAFLALFALEIAVRVLAMGIRYFMDVWNLFDFFIVGISWVFAIQRYVSKGGTSSTTLALLRLLRLLRLVNGLRKLSANKKKAPTAGAGLQFSSPVERVLEVFREVKEAKGVSSTMKDEISWAIDIVSSNKLYSISVDADKTKTGDGFLEQEVNDWVRYASDATSVHSTWKDNELEKFLLGQTKRKAHEENITAARKRMKKEVHLIVEQNKTKVDDDPEFQPKPSEDLDIEEGTAEYHRYQMEKVRDYFLTYLETALQTWEFDLFRLENWSGRHNALPLVFCECFIYHELTALFEMTLEPMLEYMKAIEEGYVEENPYHTSMHAADVTQAFHVLVTWYLQGNTTGAVGSQDIMAGLIAAAIHDYEHPAVNNAFLVRTRHPIAIRYNDISVMENHHVSAAFHVMMTLETDPLTTLSETQYQQVRKMIILMVLATDTANHFSELSLFKTKINSALNQGQAFPDKSGEDKQILMNIFLHSADISNATRPQDQYLKWVQRIMEEFFRQGDIEKEKNLPVSMFFDRESTSTSKCQQGFIDVLVLPLFTVLGSFIPEVNNVCVTQLQNNRGYVVAQGRQAGDRSGKDDDQTTSKMLKRGTIVAAAFRNWPHSNGARSVLNKVQRAGTRVTSAFGKMQGIGRLWSKGKQRQSQVGPSSSQGLLMREESVLPEGSLPSRLGRETSSLEGSQLQMGKLPSFSGNNEEKQPLKES